MAHPWCEAHMPVVPRLQGGFLNWYSTLANNVILLGILLQAQKAVAGGVPWKTWLITSSTHIAFIFFAADTRTYLDSSLKCLVNLTTSLHRCPDSDALIPMPWPMSSRMFQPTTYSRNTSFQCPTNKTDFSINSSWVLAQNTNRFADEDRNDHKTAMPSKRPPHASNETSLDATNTTKLPLTRII